MFKFLINIRVIFILWILFHIYLLIKAEYLQKVSVAFLKMEWEVVGEISPEIYPFQTKLIEHYDITEFLLYVFVPYLLFKIFKKMVS